MAAAWRAMPGGLNICSRARPQHEREFILVYPARFCHPALFQDSFAEIITKLLCFQH
jgi:hypothetical protein